MPFGVFHIPSTTGVVPVQWNCTFRPEICGNAGAAAKRIAERREPVQERRLELSPVSVRIVVRLPNGRTANTSPQ
jgi:hypothetical protein